MRNSYAVKLGTIASCFIAGACVLFAFIYHATASTGVNERIRSALSISQSEDRDAALYKAAKAAATVGDAKSVHAVISYISSGEQRDRAAKASVPLLLRLDQRTDALDVAKRISVFNERDKALVSVAKSAAASSDSENIEKVLGTMSSASLIDSTASEAAIKLAKAGKSSEAIDIAQKIGDSTLRDKTLLRISEE
jgi:hypothetical protein